MKPSRVIDDALLRIDLRDDCSGQPKYERLKEHLVSAMIAGRLRPGQVLPSVSQLAQASGLAKMTVHQAMVSLENDGLIRREQGKGSFVQDDARRKLKRGQDIFALVVPQSREGFYPSLLHGFEDAAHDFQHQTIICKSDNDLARQAEIVLQLIDKRVGGVAIGAHDRAVDACLSGSTTSRARDSARVLSPPRRRDQGAASGISLF